MGYAALMNWKNEDRSSPVFNIKKNYDFYKISDPKFGEKLIIYALNGALYRNMIKFKTT